MKCFYLVEINFWHKQDGEELVVHILTEGRSALLFESIYLNGVKLFTFDLGTIEV